jgi:WD40 repeat protein
MADKSSERHRRADEKVRKKLPPGVKLVRTLRGHTGFVARLAWSPDGRMLASPSQDKTIRLWDTETGECLRTLQGHEDVVLGVAFEPSGGLLASCGNDKTTRLWEASSGGLIRTLECQSNSVAFDPTAQVLATAGDDKTVRLWNPVSGNLLRTLEEAHDRVVTAVTFSSDGRILASAGFDLEVKL